MLKLIKHVAVLSFLMALSLPQAFGDGCYRNASPPCTEFPAGCPGWEGTATCSSTNTMQRVERIFWQYQSGRTLYYEDVLEPGDGQCAYVCSGFEQGVPFFCNKTKFYIQQYLSTEFGVPCVGSPGGALTAPPGGKPGNPLTGRK